MKPKKRITLLSIKEELCIQLHGKHLFPMFKKFGYHGFTWYHFSICRRCGYILLLDDDYITDYVKEYYEY